MITNSCTTFSTSSVLLVLFLAVSLVPSVVSSQPNCKEGAQAKIEQKGEVTLSAKVSWKPSTCNLVVQAYQGEQLVGEFGKEKGVRSGSISISQVTKGRGGRTELKVWVPNSTSPSDATWVTVLAKNGSSSK
jgi:hypothetical protein